MITCRSCPKPATCVGVYEDPSGTPEPSCDDCCGHGNEDGHCHPIGKPCARCAPAEPSTVEAFSLLREALECVREDVFPGAVQNGHLALTLLERRMQASASLAALVEAFCEDVEASERAQEAKSRGGQQVPFHGPLCYLQPSVRGELRRWARDFRKALGD